MGNLPRTRTLSDSEVMEAYRDGVAAHANREPTCLCPYAEYALHAAWMAGWLKWATDSAEFNDV